MLRLILPSNHRLALWAWLLLMVLVLVSLWWLDRLQRDAQQNEALALDERVRALESTVRDVVAQHETRLQRALQAGEGLDTVLIRIAPDYSLQPSNGVPDFSINAYPNGADPSPVRLSQLNDDRITPTGRPIRWVAALELLRSQGRLDDGVQQQIGAILTEIWRNDSGQPPRRYLDFLNRLPSELEPHFERQRQSVNYLLGEPAGGPWVTLEDGTVLAHMDDARWAEVGRALENQGIILTSPTYQPNPDYDLGDVRTFLKQKHRTQRLLLYLGGGLGLMVLLLLGLLVRALLITQERRRLLLHGVSHEFRTPLTAILQFSELLRDGRVDNPQRQARYYDLIHQQGKRLQNLVENVLAYARIEKRMFQVRSQPEQLGPLFTGIVEALNNPEEAPVSLVIGQPHETVLLDRDGISRIIENLVVNARKYGAPPIDLLVEIKDNQLLLDLSDKGAGVSADVRRVLFKPYVAPKGDHHGGLGLGLHLVKTMVDAHGGQIDLVPREDDERGARFLVRIPIQQKEEAS